MPALVDGQPRFVSVKLANGQLRVPHHQVESTTALEIPATLPAEAQLTELKAAYLIAFTTLGYSFAGHTALDPIRAAISTGDPSQLKGPVPLVHCQFAEQGAANSVVISESGVVVIGDDPHWGVLLPNPDSEPTKLAFQLDVHGDLVPWPGDRWWKNPQSVAFRWDCERQHLYWRVVLASQDAVDD